MPGQDQYVALPNGSYVHIPGDATPEQLSALRTKLQGIRGSATDPLMDRIQATARGAGVGSRLAAPQWGTPPGIAPTPPSLSRTESQMNEEGQRVNDYNNPDVMMHRAATSPTPVTDASAILYPRAALTSAVATPVGAYVGRKAGGLVDQPQAGQNIGALIASLLSGLGHEVGEKVQYEPAQKVNLPWWLGGGEINRKIPPQEIEYQKAKTITEAQEAAIEKNKIVDARAAKAREVGYNKQAEENMAIQKRFDDAQAERIAAEKEVKNARLKAEQEHAKELSDMEAARQKELATNQKLRDLEAKSQSQAAKVDKAAQDSLQKQIDAATKEANQAAAAKERLRIQHGDALMKRGKEEAQLKKQAQDSLMRETEASIEKTKRGVESLGPGRRPSTSERNLTNSVRSAVVTPEQFREEIRQLGREGMKRPDEGMMQYQARVLGLIRARRAAQGMPEPKY